MAGTLLFTGASGFLGSHLLPHVARSGRKIVCLGRRKPEANYENVDFVPGDLLDRNLSRRAVEGCDTVLHLAAATGKHRPAEYIRVNRDGTEILVREAERAGIKRFIYVSTIAVKFVNISRYHYAQSKQQAEAVVAGSGLDWTIVRPTMIFGPGSAVLEGLTRMASLPIIPVFGSARAPAGSALVQPIFVDDLARAIAATLENPGFDGRRIEIGGPDVLSIKQLLLQIRKSRGISKGRVIRLPARPVAFCLGLVEPVLRPLLPVTAGQLASFTNDGVADPDPCVARWQDGMRRIEEMLPSAK